MKSSGPKPPLDAKGVAKETSSLQRDVDKDIAVGAGSDGGGGTKKIVLEFDTKAGVAPLQIVWCGEDSVALHWRQLGLLMVGPFGDWVKYSYDEPLVLVQEVDCCRQVEN